MPRGVIEMETMGGEWSRAASTTLEDWLIFRLHTPIACAWPYRYREGSRAVLLWPESEMGKVVELAGEVD